MGGGAACTAGLLGKHGWGRGRDLTQEGLFPGRAGPSFTACAPSASGAHLPPALGHAHHAAMGLGERCSVRQQWLQLCPRKKHVDVSARNIWAMDGDKEQDHLGAS